MSINYLCVFEQVYEGEWVDDQPKCGEYREPNLDELTRFGSTRIRKEFYTFPPIGLADPKGVLDMEVTATRLEQSSKRGVSTGVFDADILAGAREAYDRIDINRVGFVPLQRSQEVFSMLGIDPTNFDLNIVFQELEIGAEAELSFPEIIDIAMYIYSNAGAA